MRQLDSHGARQGHRPGECSYRRTPPPVAPLHAIVKVGLEKRHERTHRPSFHLLESHSGSVQCRVLEVTFRVLQYSGASQKELFAETRAFDSAGREGAASCRLPLCLRSTPGFVGRWMCLLARTTGTPLSTLSSYLTGYATADIQTAPIRRSVCRQMCRLLGAESPFCTYRRATGRQWHLTGEM